MEKLHFQALIQKIKTAEINLNTLGGKNNISKHYFKK